MTYLILLGCWAFLTVTHTYAWWRGRKACEETGWIEYYKARAELKEAEQIVSELLWSIEQSTHVQALTDDAEQSALDMRATEAAERVVEIVIGDHQRPLTDHLRQMVSTELRSIYTPFRTIG